MKPTTKLLKRLKRLENTCDAIANHIRRDQAKYGAGQWAAVASQLEQIRTDYEKGA